MNRLLFMILFTFVLFAQQSQTNFITEPPNGDQYLVAKKIMQIEEFLNSGNLKYLKEDSLNDYFSENLLKRTTLNNSPSNIQLIDINIHIKEVEIINKTAKVNVVVSFSNSNSWLIVKTTNLNLELDKTWKFSDLGSLEDTFFGQ